jgi:HTH-type transcriptional regulator/antitoxin MqsA
MRCPSCGGAELEHDKRDLPYTYKGARTVFAGIEWNYCPKCGESTMGL